MDFYMKVQAAFTELKDAISPLDLKIKELNRDWEPKEFRFWSRALRQDVPAIQAAVAKCLHVVVRSPEHPEVAVATLQRRCHIYLSHIGGRIEEVGIKLTATLHDIGRTQSAEAQIRKRQDNKRVIEDLSKAVHEALDLLHQMLKEINPEFDSTPKRKREQTHLHAVVVVEADQTLSLPAPEGGQGDE
jgi:hypothetical protein